MLLTMSTVEFHDLILREVGGKAQPDGMLNDQWTFSLPGAVYVMSLVGYGAANFAETHR